MSKKPIIYHPIDCVNLANSLVRDTDRMKENFIVICLSSRNHVNRAEVVSVGTLDSTLVHPRETLRPALVSRSAGFICLHNHPSGSVHPSAADLKLTKRLKKAGEIMGLILVDHIIFYGSKWNSIMKN